MKEGIPDFTSETLTPEVPATEKVEKVSKKKEKEKPNPWAAFGPALPKIAKVAKPKKPIISPEFQKQIDLFKIEQKKRYEVISEAKLSFSFNKQSLKDAKLPKQKRFDYKEEDEEDKKLKRDLEMVLEKIGQLPENLDFKPGITLIVGDNGTGKSTLAKAIFLALEYKNTSFLYKEMAALDYKRVGEDFFNEADKRAWKATYEPDAYDYQALFLRQAGLAPEIAKAINVTDYDCRGSLQYTDCPKVIGERRTLEEKHFEYERDDLMKGYSSGDWRWNFHLSHRQTLDETLVDLKKDSDYGIGEKGQHRILFIDEPETGLSPRRHLNIEKEIEAIMVPGSIAILPTNSVVLYESDLPRIDLDYPERGIFKPSEYPEDGK